MKSSTSYSGLRPFGLCVVLLLISTQSWAGCVSGNCVNGQYPKSLCWDSVIGLFSYIGLKSLRFAFSVYLSFDVIAAAIEEGVQ
jgi:hypothetical protein